jgi:transposase-like protein
VRYLAFGVNLQGLKEVLGMWAADTEGAKFWMQVVTELTLRKVSKNRAQFPNDEAVFKLLYLALRNISKRWTMPIKNWSGAMNQFAILFDGRVPMGGLSSSSLTQTA